MERAADMVDEKDPETRSAADVVKERYPHAFPTTVTWHPGMGSNKDWIIYKWPLGGGILGRGDTLEAAWNDVAKKIKGTEDT